MDLATKTIEIARTQIGVTEHPAGSNRGPEVDVYLRSVGLDAKAGKFAWCAALVSWSVQQAALALGVKPQFKGSAGALRLLAKNPGLVIDQPEPNCIFVIDHGQNKGHAGFVYAIDVKDPDICWTVEGNSDAAGSRTGGSCVLRQRRAQDCAGFLRIA